MLKFDPNLNWLFKELPMERRYEAAARAGFKGVEVALPYNIAAPDMAKLLADNGLTMVQILVPFDWDREAGFASHPERVADFRINLDIALDYAVRIGKPLVNVMAGNLPKNAPRDRYRATLIENLILSATLAEREGITIIIEPCCRARFRDFFYATLAEGLDIIRATGKSNIRLCYDTYHVQMEEGMLTPPLREFFPHIGHMQIGNNLDRHEPGRGEINFPYLFEQIEALGWDGWIGCEYVPTGRTEDSFGWARPYQAA